MAELLVQLFGLMLFAVGLWVIATASGLLVGHLIERAWRRYYG